MLPRVELNQLVLHKLGVKLDEIYFGTCVKKATAVMNCPMNLDGIKAKLEAMTDAPVYIGTHEL